MAWKLRNERGVMLLDIACQLFQKLARILGELRGLASQLHTLVGNRRHQPKKDPGQTD